LVRHEECVRYVLSALLVGTLLLIAGCGDEPAPGDPFTGYWKPARASDHPVYLAIDREAKVYWARFWTPGEPPALPSDLRRRGDALVAGEHEFLIYDADSGLLTAHPLSNTLSVDVFARSSPKELRGLLALPNE
jgi:hypothetical protein